jgi:hypothetical protein
MQTASVEVIDKDNNVAAAFTFNGKQKYPGLFEGALNQVGVYNGITDALEDGQFRVDFASDGKVYVWDKEGVIWRKIDPKKPVETPLIEIGKSLMGIHVRDTDSEPAVVLFKFVDGGYHLRISAVEST